MNEQNAGQSNVEPPQPNTEPPPQTAAGETTPPPSPAPPPPQHMQPYSGGDLPDRPPGPPGEIRSTGICILLFFVTLGFYSWYWYFKVHEEMKRHTGQGIGGGIALILAIFVSIVMPYISSSEVGSMYERQGQSKPVSGATGLWYFPGMFIIVGPIIWFVKTNGALNDYWASKGATAS
jgi:hypothetical protein